MRAFRPVVVALSALLAACATPASGGGTSGAPRLHAADYQPLAIGNQWTYAGKMMGQQVQKTITTTGLKEGYFADDANGMLRVDAEGLRDEKRYLLKDPIVRGANWSSIVSVSSTERYEILDAGFSISTPAGAFSDCVLVRGTNRIDAQRALRTEWTFAPGVGMVRIAITAVDGNREIPQGTLELQSFKLAQPAAKP